MQEEIQLKTNDGHTIYGTLDSSQGKPSRTLLLFVHGFTGHKNEHHYFNAVDFFNEKGFDVFRFNFYGDKPNSRRLENISLQDHFSDLNVVIDFFKDKYKSIVLIGHSLGAIVVLNANLSHISKIVLWDPSNPLKISGTKYEYNTSLDKYVFNSRLQFIVSKSLVEEWQAVDMEKLVEKINIPCKFVFAGNNNKYEIWKPYLARIKASTESSIVEGASHVFIERGVEHKLFEETNSFFE